MGDTRDYHGQPEEDRLPWLEPVEEVPVDEGVSPGRLIAGLLVALIALGLVVGGVYWLKQRATAPQVAAADENGTIAAPAAPYKVKPAEPGGMQVKGQGDSSYAASEGAEVNGQIDLSATPETPVARKPAAVAPAPAPTQVAKAPVAVPAAAKPVVAAPAAKPPVQVAKAPEAKPAPQAKPAAETKSVAGGTQVQLGAFGSEAKANAAWKSLSGRFSALGGLTPQVVSAEVNGKTVYRLRAAAGGKASEICAKLKVAGDACAVIG